MFIWKDKISSIVNNKVGGLQVVGLQDLLRLTKMIKIEKDRQINQGNRIGIPEIDLHKYSQLILDTRAKAMQWGKDNLFNK